jgi:hypothetical protein
VEAVVMVSEKALDDYEVAARARVGGFEVELDRVVKELAAAQEALSHVEITRATLLAVAASQPPAVVDGPTVPGVVAAAAPGMVIDRSQRVPVWRAGLTAEALPDCYRPVFARLLESPEPVRCGQLATALGLDLVAKKIEGVRSKLKRLVERGWAVQAAAGLFAVRA